MLNYPWFKDSYKLIKDIFNKENNLYHILLSAKYGSEENQLIWYIIRSLLCSTEPGICNRCPNCNLIKQTKSHPDLYYLKIDKDDNFNTSYLEMLLNFSKHLPLFGKFKIIVILYEKSQINENSLFLIKSLFIHINKNYSYNKIFLKVDIYLQNNIFFNLLEYCLHIPVDPPSEEMCLLWLKVNQKKIIDRFDNDDIFTALRINRNNLKKSILFLNIYWCIYIKFINIVLKNINNKLYYLFKYILDDIKNSSFYLYWLSEFLLDILKINLNLSVNCITNKRYYSNIKYILNKRLTDFNNQIIHVLLKDVVDCYSKLIRYPLINKELFLLEFMLKLVKEKKIIKLKYDD